MEDLLAIPNEKRDQSWEKSFFSILPQAQFELLHSTPVEGPDAKPYLVVKITKKGEPAHKILSWLGQKGVGLTINPDKSPPDCILSYGMIWNYLANGHFLTNTQQSEKTRQDFHLQKGQKMMAASPSEVYFPTHVRKLFGEFLRDQGVLRPRVLMLSMDSKNYDLCFSLESLGNPPKEEWQGILEAFSWFFPLHYSLCILSETFIQGIDFVDL